MVANRQNSRVEDMLSKLASKQNLIKSRLEEIDEIQSQQKSNIEYNIEEKKVSSEKKVTHTVDLDSGFEELSI